MVWSRLGLWWIGTPANQTMSDCGMQAAGSLVMLGILATGGATWCYFIVVTERGPGFLSTINYLIPAVAFAAGTVFLAEPWGWEHLLALALILVGVALIQVRKP